MDTRAIDPDILDSFLTAIQNGDWATRDQLLQIHPLLLEYRECFEAVDQLASQPAPVNDARCEPARNTWRTSSASAPLGEFANGKYELLREISRGGMGIVFLARQKSLNRIVAIKMILSSHLATDNEIERFQFEAHAVARLSHRNIVPVYDCGNDQGRHYFVMEFVDGKSLSTVLATQQVTRQQTITWMIRISEAVHHLHMRGIIHRDLKPSNILIDSEQQPIITDFGLAKMFDGDSERTRDGMIVGTPSYMSPEQASGARNQVTAQSDVYSLGAVLYEFLTGRPPFRESSAFETLVQVIEKDPALPRTISPEIPRTLELICLKCLEKDPARRYATAIELAKDLSAYLHGDPLQVREGGILQSIVRWTRREPSLVIHLSTQVTAALILQVQYLCSTHTTRDEHVRQICVLAVWGALSFLWARLMRLKEWTSIARTGAATTDAALLTIALILSSDHHGTLLVFFPLLITVSGLSLQTQQVWITTGASLAGFFALLISKPELRDPWHFPLLILTTIVATGITTGWQINRIRRFQTFRRQDL